MRCRSPTGGICGTFYGLRNAHFFMTYRYLWDVRGADYYRQGKLDRPIVVVAFQATVEADELAFGGFETDFEALDFTEPAVHPGFGDSLAEVADDLDELPRRDAKHRTPQARVLMLAR